MVKLREKLDGILPTYCPYIYIIIWKRCHGTQDKETFWLAGKPWNTLWAHSCFILFPQTLIPFTWLSSLAPLIYVMQLICSAIVNRHSNWYLTADETVLPFWARLERGVCYNYLLHGHHWQAFQSSWLVLTGSSRLGARLKKNLYSFNYAYCCPHLHNKLTGTATVDSSPDRCTVTVVSESVLA